MNFSLFWTVLKTNAKDSLFSGLKLFRTGERKKDISVALSLNKDKVIGKNIAAKIGLGILMFIGIVALVFYLIFYVATITSAAVTAGVHRELLYTLLGIVQILVLFLGSMTTLNYMYFGKDNQLLMTLPISSRVVFSVKFALSYLSELLITVFFGLPVLITYGVTCGINGIALGAGFYIISIFSVFLLPIIPLLVICILSLPLMYAASFLKKRVIGKSIVVALISLFFMAIYFIFISGTINMSENMDESGNAVLSSTLLSLISGASKVSFYNYNLINALVGQNAFLNFIFYLLEIIGVFVIAVLLSSVFYKKGINVVLEDSGVVPKSKRKVDETKIYRGNGFRMSFFIKEIKTFLSTPSLFMNGLIGIVAIPLLMIIMGSNVFVMLQDGATLTIGLELGSLGFMCYLASIMISGTNTFSLVGISLEGKNIVVLKSLPLSPRDIVFAKLLISNIYNIAMACIAGITFICVSDFHNIGICLATIIILTLNGFAVSAIGLLTDLRKPNCNYKNINELTKNNKRTIKPMLISLGIGLSYMIMGIVFATLCSSGALKDWTAYVIFFGVELLINGLFGFVSIRKLFENVDEYFDRIEV